MNLRSMKRRTQRRMIRRITVSLVLPVGIATRWAGLNPSYREQLYERALKKYLEDQS